MSYIPPAHTQQHWHVTKPSASGKKGIVVSQSRGAAEAGVAVLEAGGNAFDAAVATALALTCLEPWNSGIGGIGFAVLHRAGQKTAETLDFGPVSPHRLDPRAFKLTGRMTTQDFKWPEVEGDINIHGPMSIAVPSSVAGYHKLHSTYGKLPLTDVIAPAVALAKRGLPLDWFTGQKLAASASVLRKYAESARIYLMPDGLPPTPASHVPPTFIKQGKLADTLARLQHAGLRDYYEGDIAAELVKDAADVGSIIDAEDLRRCQTRFLPATEVAWRNGRIVQTATGLTAGPTLARVLEQMRSIDFPAKPDAAWYKSLIRILRDAYAERLSVLGEADPKAAESCTTHLTTCDADGNMVAMTTTLMSGMGSKVVFPRTGVLGNNGIMWFDPRPGVPNSLAPGKRPLTNMCPIILKENDKPILAAGASGGRRIMAAVFQLMTYIADFGMDPETAGHHPRIDVSGVDDVSADPRLGAAVIAALQADSPCEVLEHGVSANYACPNVILQRPDGTRTGMSDAQSPWSAAIAQG